MTRFAPTEARARSPLEELAKLKNEIAVERLVEARGIALSKKGHYLVGRCPFHAGDDDPSLVVTPRKNLWHCFGCGAGGDMIQWVMKAEGVSFRHAVQLLREGVTGQGGVVKRASVPKLLPPVSLDADDEAFLRQVVDYYHRCLLEDPAALAYAVDRRGLSREAVEHFKLGYSNRTLGLRLPKTDRVDGAAVRARLQELGVVRDSGHEHFRGSLVVPIVDEDGRVRGMYGPKINDNLRPGTPRHLYLPGPHRGVFNAQGLRGQSDVVLCESLIDALTFFSAGIKNVEMLGHASLETTQIYTHVSIDKLKAVHAMAHPAHLDRPAAAAPASPPGERAVRADLLAALDKEHDDDNPKGRR